MSYVSKHGNRPPEFASKSSHSYIINDRDVINYLEKCDLPKDSKDITIDTSKRLIKLKDSKNPIKYIIAIDGGYTEVQIKKNFPSATLAFFQFGAIFFSLEDLHKIANQPFIFPEDMEKFKELERIKLVLPTSNISYENESSLTKSVRRTIYSFFEKDQGGGRRFLDSLHWFIFEEYNIKKSKYILSSCPNKICSQKNINLNNGQFIYKCSKCNEEIFLTDVFRLHEAIDDDLGASGILGYMTALIEQIIIVHYIKFIFEEQPSLFSSIFFLKDGPLAFFGQTANMHRPMRNLTNFLHKKYDLYLAGLEKSGAFVEHAIEICSGKYPKIKENQILLLDNQYIYKYIVPGKAEESRPYASTSYYSSKIIFKDKNKKIHVITMPVASENVVLDPNENNFKNLHPVLSAISDLKCDMYDNALVPVALVNHLISLANHPSATLLEKFAKTKVSES